MHRVCVKRKTCTKVHPQEPRPVQVVGLRDVTRLRVHHLRHDPDQHVVAGHEVLPTAGTVHAVPRCPQRHLHRLLHHGVRPQTRGVQIQSKFQTFIENLNVI